MIVQDAQVIPNSLTQIFQDPQQRNRILKIIIQTLYNLGYQQSAAQLQAQSKITYYTPQIKQIKNALSQQKYDKIQSILQNTKNYQTIKDIVNQLKCFKLIKSGQMDQALLIIQNQIKSSSKQAELSQQLMMGTGQINQHILRKKHDQILQKCFDMDICPNSMLKMINSYIQLEKRGLTHGIFPQFSLLKKSITSRKPPMKIIQTYHSSNIKKISFIKFNRTQSKFVVISSIKKQKNLTIWTLNRQKQKIYEIKNCLFSINEQIININWNYQQNQLISLATHNYIFIFNNQLKILHKKKINSTSHHNNKILSLNWNPSNHYLYVGGSFQNIKIYNKSLEQINTIQPMIRTRNLYFNYDGTIMYTVSATKGMFITYNLLQKKQQSNFLTQDIITSFRLQNKGKNIIIVTQKKILYLQILSNLQYKTLYTFDHKFSQNGLYQIQGCLFYPWIIILGPCFLAQGIENQIGKQNQWISQNSFTFDLIDGYMISGNKQLILWMSGPQMIQIQDGDPLLCQLIKQKPIIQNIHQQQIEAEEQNQSGNQEQVDIQEQQLGQF